MSSDLDPAATTHSSALWHGFADMGNVTASGPFVVSRGEGAYIFDNKGTKYLDATAGLWFTNVGHGRREIADAVATQLSSIAHYSNFGDFVPETTLALADRLAAIAPVPGSKIFFTSGGSDSIDTAAKLARRYWVEMGQPAKKIIVGRQKAYHGMHVAGTALAGIPVNKENYGELMPDAKTVAWDDAKSLLALIEEVGAENVAAFFCEPVIGAGGIYLPPEGYLREVRQICRDNDVLFVADEVVTGFGRIGGSWFASTRFELEPDLMTTAKGLTSGYVPMGAVFIAPKIAEPFFAGGVWWRHGYTYGGHAGAAAAAMANLDIIEREELLSHSKRIEAALHTHLAPLAAHDRVSEIRSGIGAVAAVQLADPAEALPFVKTLRAHGVSGRAAGQGAMQISPAFVMTDAEIEELAARILSALG
ncbi:MULTISPECIES: aminotransferase family protein [unclassified Rhodococcus (in: high G+C Gram-positive bacteria)]|uniref:aminotransferase family protein n=1 Tax=unclassified Rhodococcus (in: high G+C Gram-positive bacteria) TaxID=192944 RepID=UPI0007BB0059|nr:MULTISPECIES: aminotransferase class III-fold pyridoxal phosphate-dependent enzyme [unclassified Rhodococcus (in: high G+C Gram-positive bacteria)]KZE99838.1 adenosylmethionine-8-amino-7-oxononanoate aminotransferase [Rhodococcus sp. EPR-279]KZF04267.1 adenosylmethionine-8-amino-7-oxononanoate aminotransferase [Rhodococcus sp. EPR-147]OZE31591.1 aspartate aminotransferase family protein [Rhodococcus sp. 05-2254-4]OZE40361.1 aspartate aminotransferase family protein [Rhodococcus sp. 05-2254-6